MKYKEHNNKSILEIFNESKPNNNKIQHGKQNQKK